MPSPTVLASQALLLAALAWNLVGLRAELEPVAYLNDSSMHEQMVRFAARLWAHGRLPLTSWFPFLGEGSPQYLHYQSLPAMLTGAVGLLVGPNVAFRWSLYLLLCLWPVSVFIGARLFGLDRAAAALAAAMSPFLFSIPGVGYEQHAYVWRGYGVWTQLWAAWTLPLAWGLSWRALRTGRGVPAAVVAVAATIALHFETGYLALLPVPIWALVAHGPRRRRAWVCIQIDVCALLLAAWVVWPLIDQTPWAARNEALQATPLVNGYGATLVLRWLVSGGVLDAGRLPVITTLLLVGLARCLWLARRRGKETALLAAIALCLVLSFGPATIGPLRLLPGGHDIFFRRFLMGVQLSGVWLSGLGARWAITSVGRAIARVPTPNARRISTCATLVVRMRGPIVLGVIPLLLAPAWLQLDRYDTANSAAIAAQRTAERVQGPHIAQLIALIQRSPSGRVYAGTPANWGTQFRVGAVPVFKYLERFDVDEVGYTLRTASLMTQSEYRFDERNPADYRLFGISYLILPAAIGPPVPAHLLTASGQYALWRVFSGGYLQAATVIGTVGANRVDVAAETAPVLRHPWAARHEYIAVDWDEHPRLRLFRASTRDGGAPGDIISAQVALTAGRARAIVEMRAPGAVVLSASYDPGWQATVDGRRQPVIAVAPALTAVSLKPGTHDITFTYRGYDGYRWLFLLSTLTSVGLVLPSVRTFISHHPASG